MAIPEREIWKQAEVDRAGYFNRWQVSGARRSSSKKRTAMSSMASR